MFSDDLLRIGDVVVVSVYPEQRQWSNIYNDVPDGTQGTVCGFHDIVFFEPRAPVLVREPGVYHHRGTPSVLLDNGRIISGGISISMVDTAEMERRCIELQGDDGLIPSTIVRLGNLPDTLFWEQDKVKVRFPREAEAKLATIQVISYRDMHQKRADGSPWPFYTINLDTGGHTYVEESWIELIQRGNVWKFHNGEELVFADLKDEAEFYRMVGHCEQLRNPGNSRFDWTMDEALEAIRSGTAHGILMSSELFGSPQLIFVERFRDEDLGRRIATATLEEFTVAE